MAGQDRRIRRPKADTPVASVSVAGAPETGAAAHTRDEAAHLPDATPIVDDRGTGALKAHPSEDGGDDEVVAPKRAVPATRKRDVSVAKPDNGDVRLGFLSESLGFHLRLAQDASYRTFAKHHDKDLIKPGRYPALAIIHLNPGISQSALGRAIARDKSTVSPLIKDLQKNGFINRKASTQDRRSVTLALTKKGERTLEKLRARATEHEEEFDRLVGPSKARLMSLLGKIIASMSV